MEITFNARIPDDVASDIRNGSDAPLPRRLLELAAIKAYEAGLISARQVREMLGFANREELFIFFKANDVRDHSFTIEDLEQGRATLDALLNKQ